MHVDYVIQLGSCLISWSVNSCVAPSTISFVMDLYSLLSSASWVKMRLKSLHHFNIQLYTTFPTICNPRELDHVLMDIFFASDLGPDIIKSLSRCRGAMRTISLSDLSSADGKYLKNFVFNPGMATAGSMYIFPREKPVEMTGITG